MRMIIIALAALVPATSLAQAANHKPIEIPFEKFVLSNGLTVITHEDHASPIVAATVWYRVGTRDERPGRSGFAHLFEHLLIAAHDSLTSVLASAGALELNGTYGRDATRFYATLPSSMLDLLLFYQARLMGSTGDRITQSLLEKERGIVKNENREYQENQSFGRAPLLLAQATYPPGHPYSSVGLGSLTDLDAATPADAVAWLTAYYGPSNAVLVVAGDFNAAAVKEKIEHYFGAIPRGPVQSRTPPIVARGLESRLQTVHDRVPNARLYRAWNISEWGSADAQYLELASLILDGGSSSRLHQRLVQREKIATAVSASVNLFQLGGQFSLVVTPTQEGDLPAIARAIDEEIDRFIEDGPSPMELAHAQRRYRANFVRGIERIGSEQIGGYRGRSDLLAENEVIGGRADLYTTSLSRVASAGTAELRGAAERWLKDGAFTLELRPLPAAANGGRAAASVDWTNAPRPEPFPAFTATRVQPHRLANGLRMLLVERLTIPLVELRMRIGSGSSTDRAGEPGRAELTTQLLSEGTTRRDGSRISEEVLDMGARISASVDDDASVITVSGPADEMPRMLDLLADLIRNPTFPEAAVQGKSSLHAARLQRERASAPALPGALLQRLLEGSLVTPDLPDSARRPAVIRRDDLLAFFRAAFRPDNATLIVSGATTMDALVSQVEQAFGGWQRTAAPLPSLSGRSAPDSSPVVYLVDSPGATQSVIAAGHLTMAASDPDFPVMRIIATTLRFRLTANLREAKQWAYSPYAYIGSGASGRQILAAVATVQQDKTAEAMLEILHELRGLTGTHPVTPEEMERAKTSELRLLAVYSQTNALTAQQVDDASRVAANDVPDFHMVARRLAAIGLADVSRVATRLLRPERLAWLVIGDEQKITQSVGALKLGEIRRLASDGTLMRRD
ncbi:MAG: M16 family metallopeptidase [Gemmatimonadaceae bacterium]